MMKNYTKLFLSVILVFLFISNLALAEIVKKINIIENERILVKQLNHFQLK